MKGLSITGWVVVLMVFVTVAYTILVSVASIGAQVGAEYWRRSGYYVAARTADSITNLAYSDANELLVTMNLEDVDSCTLEVRPDSSGLGGMVYANVVYKKTETESASRFIIGDMQIDSKNVNCKARYLRVKKEANKIILEEIS